MYGDLIRGNDPRSWAPWDDPAGYRDYADAAYHLNRVRYDVSLINCEDSKCDNAPRGKLEEQDYYIEGVGEPLEIIEDYTYDFEDGEQLQRKELQRIKGFDRLRQRRQLP